MEGNENIVNQSFIKLVLFGGQDKGAWSLDLRERYLRKLKQDNPTLKIKIGTGADEFYKEIEKISLADPHYEVFKRFHKEFEKNRGKVYNIFTMPDGISSMKEEFLSLSPVRYNIGQKADNFSCIEIERNQVEFMSTDRKNTRRNIVLTQGNFDNDTWESILRALQSENSEVVSIDMLKASAISGFSFVSSALFDFANKTIFVSTDSHQRDGEGRRKDREVMSDFRAVLNRSILKADPLADMETVNGILTRSKIDNHTIEVLTAPKLDDFIAIPCAYTYRIVQDEGGIDNFRERVHNYFDGIKESQILRVLADFFEKGSTLRGFLTKHPEFNPEKAKGRRQMASFTEVTGGSYLFFYLKEPESGETGKKVTSKDGADKILTSTKIEFDEKSTNFRINSKNLSTGAKDVIYRKFIDAFKRSSTT